MTTVEEKTETSAEQSCEIGNGSIQKEIESLEPQASSLLSDICSRREEIEHGLGPAQKTVQGEIRQLRGLYEKYIGDGEAGKVEKVLDRIRTKRMELRKLAEQALKKSTNFSDLTERQKSLRLRALQIIEVAEENCKRAKELRERAGNLLFSTSDSATHHISQLRTEAEKIQLLARNILSE